MYGLMDGHMDIVLSGSASKKDIFEGYVLNIFEYPFQKRISSDMHI